jgi:inosine/xanthosine triphosphate pyrophosphatase family protein
VRTVVVATQNSHKLAEIDLTLKALLGPGIELVQTDGKAPAEDGATFEETP